MRKNGSDPSPTKTFNDASDDEMTSNNNTVNRLNLNLFGSPGKKEAMRLETCLNRDSYNISMKVDPDYAKISDLQELKFEQEFKK